MSSTRHHTKLGSVPPMSRVDWAIARYNWYRVCGLLDDLPQQTIEISSDGRSPHQPPPKPHLKWYSLSKPDDDIATTYPQPASATQRHRYSQRVEDSRSRTVNRAQTKADDPRTWSRVDWAIARYNWYRACGLLDDLASPTAETTRYQRSPDPPPPRPHLKWYPLSKSDDDVVTAYQRSVTESPPEPQRRYCKRVEHARARAMLAGYQAEQDEATKGTGSSHPFDPSKHPRNDIGRFTENGEGATTSVGETVRQRVDNPNATQAFDGDSNVTTRKDLPQRDGSNEKDPIYRGSMVKLGLRGPLIDLGPLLLTNTGRDGHHWFSQTIIKKLLDEKLLTEEVLAFFQATTTVPGEYIHRLDTWNGVTHPQYSENLEAIARKLAAKGKLASVEEAKAFFNWIMTGGGELKLFDDLLKDSKVMAQAKRVRAWAKGFFTAEIATEMVKAVDSTLNEAEVKEFAKAIARGSKIDDAELPKGMRKKFAALLTRLKDMEKAGTLKTAAMTAAKNAFKVLGVLGVLVSSAQGATGNGHNPDASGVVGAADQVLYDLVWAEYVESIAKSIGNAVVPIAGVPDSIGTRATRGGLEPYLEEGMQGIIRGHKDPKMDPKPRKPDAERWGWPFNVFNNE